MGPQHRQEYSPCQSSVQERFRMSVDPFTNPLCQSATEARHTQDASKDAIIIIRIFFVVPANEIPFSHTIRNAWNRAGNRAVQQQQTVHYCFVLLPLSLPRLFDAFAKMAEAKVSLPHPYVVVGRCVTEKWAGIFERPCASLSKNY